MTGRVFIAASAALLACAPAPRWVAVATSDAVVVLDGQLRPISRLPLPIAPQQMAFAPDGASLFVAVTPRPGASLVGRLPRTGGAIGGSAVAGEIRRIGLARDGRTLLLAMGAGPTGLIVTGTAIAAVAPMPVVCEANDLVIMESGERAFVLCADGKVVEVDPALRLVVRVVGLGSGERPCDPAAGALSANGTVLFVACGRSGTLLYLDRVTLAPFDSLITAPGARRLTVSGRHALLSVPGDEGRVIIVDVRARKVSRVLAVPGATDIALNASGGRAFVTAPPRIMEIDVESGDIRQDVSYPGITGPVTVWPGPREPRMRWDDERRSSISANASVAPVGKS